MQLKELHQVSLHGLAVIQATVRTHFHATNALMGNARLL